MIPSPPAALRGLLALGLLFTLGCPDDGQNPTSGVGTPSDSPTQSGPVYVGDASALDFGEATVGGDPAEATLTITNAGTVTLTVNSQLASGSEGSFAILSDVTTVEPGASAALTLTFGPAATGPVTGTLNLFTNDPYNLEIALPLSGTGVAPDVDGDGSPAGEDCDDEDDAVYPGATEACDATDNDCDGAVDEDIEVQIAYPDADGDGYGESGAETETCDPAPGSVTQGGDCDDGDAAIYPGAPEVCDGVDSNCDGDADDDLIETLYPDQDGDGFGDPAGETQGCPEAGYVDNGGDCDDGAGAVFPGASEVCDGIDNNCDGQTDEGLTGTYYTDGDGDGFGDDASAVTGCGGAGLVETGGDCDDGDGAILPGATEACDGVDNDCDGATDEGLVGTYYTDADGDGFGDDATAATGCGDGGGVAQGGDCDDAAPETYPGAGEACDSKDNDCDSATDEGLTGTYYGDADGDGFGDPTVTQEGCSAEGFVDNPADCDDGDAAINPDAPELCDDLDNDCDGAADEGVATAYYNDADGDGYGEEGEPTLACAPLAESATRSGDCDDTRGDVSPDATELCDGIDNNCDGVADENTAEDAATWYLDNDGDSFGIAGSTALACTRPNGFAALSGDCDDTLPAINPGAEEICGDDVDNNCDGEVDEDDAPGAGTFYPDGDGDGYGVDEGGVRACVAPEGYAPSPGDCDDDDVAYHPGAPESDCTDPNDYNCDGSTAFADSDGDGFPACQDCDDDNATVKPNAPEICDALDNNCNGVVDEGVQRTFYIDNDGDGYGALYNSVQACEVPDGYAQSGGDCNDFSASISPGSAELCDDIDNNCNGFVDEGLEEVSVYPDLDGDTHGATGSRPLMTCLSDSDGDGIGDEPPYGYGLVADDCDDSDVLVYTGAPERCDGEDNDCNGRSDETCFGECGGSWPFRLDYSLGTPQASLVDMNGDNQFEVVIQDNFGFAILGKDGVPYYNYSAPNHNYSRGRMVTADIDTYDRFTADTQGVEILTGNGSRPRFYKLNGDRSVTVYEHAMQVYDASPFMASDIDGDGAPELLTTSWCVGSQSVMGFDFDRGAGVIGHMGDIPDPDNTCEYTNGRVLTDLDGDGTQEIVIGNGYGQAISPNVWAGQIYAFDLTDPGTMSWDYHCDPETCFPTDVDDLFEGNVGALVRTSDGIHASLRYFTEDVSGANNPSLGLYWYYGLDGQPQEGYPASSFATPFYPTDIQDDGAAEHRSEVAYIGLYDVNGDGHPDRIYTSGDELRLALWDADAGTFVEVTSSRLSPSGQPLALRSIWDSDGDGRLNVISADDGGNVFCHELGQETWNPYTSLPPHHTDYLRTYQWDNYEPNEGADTTGDGIPDAVIGVASALTRYGHFYSYLSTPEDVDAYRIDTGWSPNICLRSPPGRRYRLKVYSYLDRWNNDTQAPSADGVVDGLLWTGDTAAGGQVCFTSGSVAPPRNGEYRFIAQIETVDGDASPYWPYWLSARK